MQPIHLSALAWMLRMAACANISLFLPNTAENQPVSGWFLFPKSQNLLKKVYFMLLCDYAIAGNVYPELATCKIP